MTRMAVLFACSMILTSCATPSAPKDPPPAEQPAPKAPDPRVCAKVEPEPSLPRGASLPMAVGPIEQQAKELFLGWSHEILAWGRAGWARAETARAGCGDGLAGQF